MVNGRIPRETVRVAEGIGIIGAGVAGLHLGLYLQLHGVPASRQIADEFTNNFNHPERQWDILATPERTRSFLGRHGLG
jgi:2-polyprenyl-6-methoxyphenol hydroxylase-like FAD-dependent oxidoreductase